jgi:hypothetical protein
MKYIDVASTPGSATSSATIYADFDNNNLDPSVVPGCELNASWPSWYNCLHTATGKLMEIYQHKRFNIGQSYFILEVSSFNRRSMLH